MTTSAPTDLSKHNSNNSTNNDNNNNTNCTITTSRANASGGGGGSGDSNPSRAIHHQRSPLHEAVSDVKVSTRMTPSPAATGTLPISIPPMPMPMTVGIIAPLTTPPIAPPTTTNNNNNNIQANQTRTMQSDEDFNIRFVNLVRTHKCLYDKKVPEYRNRDNQEKAWMLISQETRESVIHCKERWRNLRACLSRYIKQQSGAEPQHKPYYLAEHMSFLLPFLKSTRNNSQDYINLTTSTTMNTNAGSSGPNSLSGLFQISQHQQEQALNHIHLLGPHAFGFYNHSGGGANGNGSEQKLELKHSVSENDDEETIDAFDPSVTASLQQMQQRLPHNGHHISNNSSHNHNSLNHNHNGGRVSSPLSDTASANTLQNFIPDVQISELPTSIDRRGSDYNDCVTSHTPHKRIKMECHASEATTTAAHLHGSGSLYGACENADMEFFRSILPDLAALTPQQKRKFKIGILELIDDVIERYPGDRSTSMTSSAPTTNTTTNACVNSPPPPSVTIYRRNASRDWRK